MAGKKTTACDKMFAAKWDDAKTGGGKDGVFLGFRTKKDCQNHKFDGRQTLKDSVGSMAFMQMLCLLCACIPAIVASIAGFASPYAPQLQLGPTPMMATQGHLVQPGGAPVVAGTVISTGPAPAYQEQAPAFDAGVPASRTLPEGWEEHTDPTTQGVYFHNPTTGETTWERPTGGSCPGTGGISETPEGHQNAPAPGAPEKTA